METKCLIFAIIGLNLCLKEGCCDSLDEEKKYAYFLPQDYESSDPPKGSNLTIYVEVQILSIESINIARNTIDMELWVNMVWAENRINASLVKPKTFIPSEHLDILWFPKVDLEEVEKVQLISDKITPYPVWVENKSNLIHYKQRYSLQLHCEIKLAFYPMDVQRCKLDVTPEQLADFNLTPVWLTDENNPQKYRTAQNHSSKVFNQIGSYLLTGIQKSLVDNFDDEPSLRMTLTFERQLIPTLIQVYFPSTLIVCVASVSFWIDPVDAVAGRVGLGVTAMLTLMTQFLSARKDLPSLSYVTALDIWLLFCLAMACLSLVEFALAYTIAKRGRSKRGITLIPDPATVSNNESRGLSFGNKRRWTKLCLVFGKFKDIDAISRIVYPLIFVIFSLLYWTSFL